MRVYIINAVYGILSTGRTYRELHDNLVANGHECEVFYGEHPTDAPDTHYMGSTLSHKAHALRSRITGKSGFYSTHATKKLLRYMDEKRPDVVHLGNLHGNYVNIPMLLSYLAKKQIATVVTLHDCYFFTGGCTHYTLNKCNKWQTLCKTCPYYKAHGSWLFDRTALLHQYKIDGFHQIPRLGVIGVSDWITDEARKSAVFKDAYRFQRVYNWVDLSVFKPVASDVRKRHGIPDDRYIVLGVASSWGAGKGLSDFIELARQLGDGYRVVLVGKMPEDAVLPDNLISVPPTNNTAELAEYDSAADVFVQLSKEETFGKVVAEALACGTPAVVFDSTASPELVKDGCGIALPTTADMGAFAEAIGSICRDTQTDYRARCRDRAERSFNKETNCGEIEALYQALTRS